MTWSQTYDPLGSLVLSTLLAALPVVVLLGGLAVLRWQAHVAAMAGLAAALVVAIGPFGMPAPMAVASAAYGAAYGSAAHRMDRRQRHLSLSADERARPVRRAASEHHARHRGPSPAAAGGGVLFRRVLRGRFGVRHASRRHRRDPDRAGVFAAGRVGVVADRQHRAGRVWRPRHARDRAAERHWTRPARVERHGRPTVAAVLGDRAVLAGVRVCRLARHARGVARDPRGRPGLCDPAVSRLQLSRAVAGGRRRGGDVHGARGVVPARVAPSAPVDVRRRTGA